MAGDSIAREQLALLLKTTQIDRRLCTRVVPMRVLVLGFPRTGTACMNSLRSFVCTGRVADSE